VVSPLLPGEDRVGQESCKFIVPALDGVLVFLVAGRPLPLQVGVRDGDGPVREINDRLELELAALPPLERVAKDRRREPAPFALIAELTGRNEIGMIVDPILGERNVMVTDIIPKVVEGFPAVEAEAASLGEDQTALELRAFMPLPIVSDGW
jgi:hypothetical protein